MTLLETLRVQLRIEMDSICTSVYTLQNRSLILNDVMGLCEHWSHADYSHFRDKKSEAQRRLGSDCHLVIS